MTSSKPAGYYVQSGASVLVTLSWHTGRNLPAGAGRTDLMAGCIEVREYIEASAALENDFFPDLSFTNYRAGAELSIAIPASPVRFIRLSLQEKQPLNLASVLMVGDDGEVIDLGACATLSMSSSYGGEDMAFWTRKFFNGRTRHVGLHTQNEEGPWALVELDSPQWIKRIVLRNRGDQYAFRSRTMRIEASADGTEWFEIYDAVKRLDLLRGVLGGATALGFRGRIPDATIELLNDLILCILFHDRQGAVDAFRSASHVARDERFALIEFLNSKFLAPRGLEWTSHGIHRSFRYWSPNEREAYVRFASEIVDILAERFTGRVCFGFGAVLGVVRDKALIPHDDDLDIIVLLNSPECRTFDSGKAIVAEYLRQRGLLMGAEHPGHIKVRRQGQKSVDVFVGLQESLFATWYPGPRREILVSDVYPPVCDKLYDVECMIPCNPDAYLAKVYGPTWSKPQPTWRHQWDRAAVSDLFR
ncbi:discoidin domain-containing protein [Hansschlegelia beijingensis]